jgi:hypothetical protein
MEDAVLLAISMFRLPAGFDFLIALVTQKDRHSRAALSALAIHRHYPKPTENVAAAVAANGSHELEALFRRKFREDEA